MFERARRVMRNIKSGKKWLKEPWLRLRVNSLARIADADFNPVHSVAGQGMSTHGDPAAVGRKLDGVEQQMVDAVAHLRRVDRNDAKLGNIQGKILLPQLDKGANVLAGVPKHGGDIRRAAIQRAVKLVRAQHRHELINDPLQPSPACSIFLSHSFCSGGGVVGRCAPGKPEKDRQRGGNPWLATWMKLVFNSLAGRSWLLTVSSSRFWVCNRANSRLALHEQIVPFTSFANDTLQLVGIPGLGNVAVDVPLVDGVDYGPNVRIAGEQQPDRLG